MLQGARISDINEKIAEIVYRNISDYKCRDELDESELKWRLFLKSQQDYNQTQRQITQLTEISNITSSCCDEFYAVSSLHINSRNADVDSFPARRWKFTVSTSGGTSGPGKIVTSTQPSNVRSIYVTEFDIPYVIALDNTQSDRVGIVIDQFRGSAYRTALDVPYHFLFDRVVMGNRIRLIPVVDKFTFPLALTSFTDLDFIFSDTTREIDLPRDRENNATFAILAGPPIVFEVTTANPHGLSSGDTVFFNDFFTTPDVQTPEEEMLTDRRGHKISKIDGLTFTVNVDMTGNTLLFLDGWTMYYGSKQWRFPLKVQYIRPESQAQIVQPLPP
jgi:hypothetical protein